MWTWRDVSGAATGYDRRQRVYYIRRFGKHDHVRRFRKHDHIRRFRKLGKHDHVRRFGKHDHVRRRWHL